MTENALVLQNNKENDVRTCTGLLSSYHGIAYQVQWLMLVALEAKNHGSVSGFRFKTEVQYEDSGKFDDVVWQFYSTEEQKFKYNFLQTKHKLDKENEKIKFKDLLKTTNTSKANPFGLRKYFISYKNNIKNNCKYEKGVIEKLIIATNIDMEDDLKIIFKPSVIDSFLNFPDASNCDTKPAWRRIDMNVNDGRIIEIVDVLEGTYDLIKLSKKLEELIFNNKELLLPGELRKYQNALFNNVLDDEHIKISNDFIINKNLSRETKYLREAFFYEAFEKKRKILKIIDRSHDISYINDFVLFFATKINNARSLNNAVNLKQPGKHKNNIQKLANFVLINVKDIIKFNPNFWTQNAAHNIFKHKLKAELKNCGILETNDSDIEVVAKLDVFNFVMSKDFKTCGIHLVDEIYFWESVRQYNNSLVNAMYFEESTKNFPSYGLNKIRKDIHCFIKSLVFAVNYTKKYLNEFVKDKFNQNIHWIDNEFTAYAFRSEIANALDLTEEKFICTSEQVSQFFNKIQQETNRLILLGPTLECWTKIHSYNIKFEGNVIDCHPLRILLGNKSNIIYPKIKTNIQVICINTQHKILSLIKVCHVLKLAPEYNTQKNYIFMRLESIINLFDYVMEVFEKSVDLMIVECNESIVVGPVRKLYKKIASILYSNPSKKVVLVTQGDHFLSLNLKKLFKCIYYEFVDSKISLLSLDNKTRFNILQTGKVIFQGTKVPLGDLVSESVYLIQNQVLDHLLNYHDIKICPAYVDKSKIINFYISRELFSKKKVCVENIINDNSQDIFAFSEIEYAELVHIALRYNKDNKDGKNIFKFNEIKRENNYSLKCVVLEKALYEFQYNQLCIFYQNRNVHWVVKEKKHFRWKQTRGNIKSLRPLLISEEYYKDNADGKSEIIHELKNENIVLIAAQPGMGKTTMMTHLSLQVKKDYPLIWIVVIDLGKIRNQLHNIRNNKTSAFKFLYNIIDFKINKSNHKILKNKIRQWFVTQQNNTIEFAQYNAGIELLEVGIFKNKLNKINEVLIIFDGFDEICPTFEKQVIYLIEVLKKHTRANLWITSRNYNVVDKLEDRFGVISYGIKPFGEEDQISFLIKFWKSCLNISEIDEKRCEVFIKSLLITFSRVTNDAKNTFVGIPLHIKMIAQNRFEMFKIFYESKALQLSYEDEVAITKCLNLVDLYEEFIDIKFNKIRFKEKKHDYPSYYDEEMTRMIKIERRIFLNEHKVLGMYALYTDVENYFPGINARTRSILSKIKKSKDKNAFVDRVINGSPSFVHQTYAEYFAGHFLWDKFKKMDCNFDYLKQIIRNLFLYSNNIQVCQFFYNIADKYFRQKILHDFDNVDDKMIFVLKEIDPLVQSLYDFCKKSGSYLDAGIDDLKFSTKFNEENSSIFTKNSNFVEVVKIMFLFVESYFSVKRKVSKNIIDIIRNDSHINLLRMASEIGCPNFVKVYKDHKIYDYESCLNRNKWYFNPLYLAAKFGHLETLNILKDLISHNWIDKEKRTLQQFAHSYRSLNVIRNCLLLNIYDANSYKCINNLERLPIIDAIEREWPTDIIKLLIHKTDATIFNNFVYGASVSCYPKCKASYRVCDFLLKYDFSITHLMLEKGMDFFGTINELIFNFSRSSLQSPLEDVIYSRQSSACSDFFYTNIFQLIDIFLKSGISYNNSNFRDTTTIQLSKGIYYMHKLLENICSNYSIVKECKMNVLDYLLKVFLNTVFIKQYFKFRKSRDTLYLYNKSNKIVRALQPTVHIYIFDCLKQSQNLNKTLENFKLYLEKECDEIKEFKGNKRTDLKLNILSQYEDTLENNSDDESKIDYFNLLSDFEKLLLESTLNLYVLQDYNLGEAVNEVVCNVERCKRSLMYMKDIPSDSDISLEEITFVFDLHCIQSCYTKFNDKNIEFMANILECNYLEDLLQLWYELSCVGEKNLEKAIKSVSKYVDISFQIFERLSKLDKDYNRLLLAMKTSEYQQVCGVLETIDKNYVKAVINGQDKKYGSPLHYSAFIGHDEIVKLLLEQGADPNLPLEGSSDLIDDSDNDCVGYTALHIATMKGHYNIVRILLKYNASCDIKVCNKISTEDIAQKKLHQNPEVYQILLNIFHEIRENGRHNKSLKRDLTLDKQIDVEPRHKILKK